ncbi:MAG: AraC family transcriptional regulator [Bacteroidota bacterium]
MLFDFSLKSSVLLIFFSQGIVFSLMLLIKGYQLQRSSSKWLSLFVFLCAMYVIPFMTGYAGWYSVKVYREVLFFIPFQQLFLIGPVLYFYTQSLLNKSFKLSKRDWIHFVPAILYLMYSLVVFVTDKLILSEFYFYADGRDKDLSPWYQVAGLISMVFYLLLSLRYYANYKIIAYQTVSFADSVLFKWVRHFFIAFLIILLLRVLFFILNPEWGQFGRKFWYYLCFSFLYYYIAFSGYSNAIRSSKIIDTSILDSEPEGSLAERNPATVLPELEVWKPKISRLMLEEKLYENPNLTLSNVAESLDTYPKIISQAINNGFAMNFNDFVNKYRIEAVIERLKKGEHNSKTLLGIALECGFNSKATFNRAFKKYTALSPKEYLVKIS